MAREEGIIGAEGDLYARYATTVVTSGLVLQLLPPPPPRLPRPLFILRTPTILLHCSHNDRIMAAHGPINGVKISRTCPFPFNCLLERSHRLTLIHISSLPFPCFHAPPIYSSFVNFPTLPHVTLPSLLIRIARIYFLSHRRPTQDRQSGRVRWQEW